MEAKVALRTRLRAARAARDPAALDRAATGLAEAGLARCRTVRTVAAYAAVRDEPPTRPLLDALVAAGLSVWLPVVRGDGLMWGPYRDWSTLTQRGDLLEPASPDNLASSRAIDLFLVPALAVDRFGNRLGRGAGYYDRALVAVEPARIIAVVFADELLDVVPVEPHDVAVGAALTPDGLVELTRPDADPDL